MLGSAGAANDGDIPSACRFLGFLHRRFGPLGYEGDGQVRVLTLWRVFRRAVGDDKDRDLELGLPQRFEVRVEALDAPLRSLTKPSSDVVMPTITFATESPTARASSVHHYRWQ